MSRLLELPVCPTGVGAGVGWCSAHPVSFPRPRHCLLSGKNRGSWQVWGEEVSLGWWAVCLPQISRRESTEGSQQPAPATFLEPRVCVFPSFSQIRFSSLFWWKVTQTWIPVRRGATLEIVRSQLPQLWVKNIVFDDLGGAFWFRHSCLSLCSCLLTISHLYLFFFKSKKSTGLEDIKMYVVL